MKKLVENVIKQFQIDKLKEEQEKHLNRNNPDNQNELDEEEEEDEENMNSDKEADENNEDIEDENENNINEEEPPIGFLEMYRPIFDSMIREQQLLEQNKIQNEKNINEKKTKISASNNLSKKYPFKRYTIGTNTKNNPKKPIAKNNFKIEGDFDLSPNVNNKGLFDPNLRKNELEYNYRINQQKKNINKIITNKNKPKNDTNDLLLQLKNMPKPQISKEMAKELGFDPRKYDIIIDKLISEIAEVRQERQKENILFQEKIRQMGGENIIYPEKKLKKNNSNAGFKKKVNKLSINKRPKSNYKVKSSGYGIQPKKNKFISSRKKIKNTKNIPRNNNNNYVQKNNFISNDVNKIPKNKSQLINSQRENKLKANVANNNQIENPELAYCQELLKQINEINKQNEIISKKYQTQKEEVQNTEKINQVFDMNKDKINKNKNLKNITDIIKKNQKLISDKIIDDLLFECVFDLKNIEDQRENNQKSKLVNQIENVRSNITKSKEYENNLISNINNNINKKSENNICQNKNNNGKINFNNYLLAKNVTYKAKPVLDLVKQCDKERKNFREYMQLKGSFYSNYDIFKIYDDVVESQCDNILGKELDYCIKQMDDFINNFEKKE